MRHCWSVARRAEKRWQASLSLSRFTSSRCLRIQPTQPAVSGGRVCASVCRRVHVCVRACPGPRYAALIKPTAKRKTRPTASSNDPEYTYGCFGENKWAENGIHKHSWYREGRGRETLSSSRGAASQTIPLSHEGQTIFIGSTVVYIWVLECDTTCQPSLNCCRRGCWAWYCCCRGQSGSLEHQTIHQSHAPGAGTVACGPDACSDTASHTLWDQANVYSTWFYILRFSELLQITWMCSYVQYIYFPNHLSQLNSVNFQHSCNLECVFCSISSPHETTVYKAGQIKDGWILTLPSTFRLYIVRQVSSGNHQVLLLFLFIPYYKKAVCICLIFIIGM